jgi:hypothetical protein
MNHELRRARVRGLVDAARRVDSAELRRRLVDATGLSSEGVQLAIREHLETNPASSEIDALLRWVGAAPQAHVVLSAHVFTAGLRALCLAAATAPIVHVRCSTREEVFAPALIAACDPELRETLRLVDRIEARAGDEVHLYGSDESIASMRAGLAAGVVVHAHGTGIGVAVAWEGREEDARALARDVVPFDQRGCLSPRIAFVRDNARGFARALAAALRTLSEAVPRGRLHREELAQEARFRDTAAVVGEVFDAGPGQVALVREALLIAPTGRNMAVVQCDDPERILRPVAHHVAAIGLSGEGEAVRRACPGARVTAIGSMQRPLLDGPVDLRHGAR